MRCKIVFNNIGLTYYADDAKELASVIWGLVSNHGTLNLTINEIRDDVFVEEK